MQCTILPIFDDAFGRKQTFLSVLIDPPLPIVDLIDRLHVILEPLILLGVCGDQEFVDYNWAACSGGICVASCILQLCLDWGEEARVRELVPIVMKQLRLFI